MTKKKETKKETVTEDVTQTVKRPKVAIQPKKEMSTSLEEGWEVKDRMYYLKNGR